MYLLNSKGKKRRFKSINSAFLISRIDKKHAGSMLKFYTQSKNEGRRTAYTP